MVVMLLCPAGVMWFYPSFRTLVTSLALISPGIASAQQYQDWTWCYEPDSTRDQTIAGCTALILSGREPEGTVARLAEPRCIRQKGIEDRLQFTRRTCDDPKRL